MLQQNTATVREGLRLLRALERQHNGTINEVRIRMLRLLKVDSTIPNSKLAAAIGVSVSEVKRWRSVYSKQGLNALLEQRTSDLNDHGVLIDPGSDSASPLIELLNALPAATDVMEWGRQFKTGLMLLFDDVDAILVVVNTACDLLDPTNYSLRNMAAKEVLQQTETDQSPCVDIDRVAIPPEQEIILGLRERNYPLVRYHDPTAIAYYFAGTAYVGGLVLLRERSKPPISPETLELLGMLEPFITTSLSNCVARHHYANPPHQTFFEMVEWNARRYQLTPREVEVLHFYLSGILYKEIAEKMSITRNTVETHLRNLRHKTGTRSLTQLFARFFTPVIGLPGEP